MLNGMPSIYFSSSWGQSVKSYFSQSGIVVRCTLSKAIYFAFMILWRKFLSNSIINDVWFSLSYKVSLSFFCRYRFFIISLISFFNFCSLSSVILMIKRLVQIFHPRLILSSSHLPNTMSLLNSNKSGLKTGLFFNGTIHSVYT